MDLKRSSPKTTGTKGLPERSARKLEVDENCTVSAIQKFASNFTEEKPDKTDRYSIRAKNKGKKQILFIHDDDKKTKIPSPKAQEKHRRLAAEIIIKRVRTLIKDSDSEGGEATEIFNNLHKKYGNGEADISAKAVWLSMQVVSHAVGGKSIDDELRGKAVEAKLLAGAEVPVPTSKRVARRRRKEGKNSAVKPPSIPRLDLTGIPRLGRDRPVFADETRQEPSIPHVPSKNSDDAPPEVRGDGKRKYRTFGRRLSQPAIRVVNAVKRVSQTFLPSRPVQPVGDDLTLHGSAGDAFEQIFAHLGKVHTALYRAGKVGTDGALRWTDRPIYAAPGKNGEVTISLQAPSPGKPAKYTQNFVDFLVEVINQEVARHQGLSENPDVQLVLRVIRQKAVLEKAFFANDARLCVDAISKITRGAYSKFARKAFQERFADYLGTDIPANDVADPNPQDAVGSENDDTNPFSSNEFKSNSDGSFPGSASAEGEVAGASAGGLSTLRASQKGESMNPFEPNPEESVDSTNPFGSDDVLVGEQAEQTAENPTRPQPATGAVQEKVDVPSLASSVPRPPSLIEHVDCGKANKQTLKQELNRLLRQGEGSLRGYLKLDKKGNPVTKDGHKDGQPVIVLRCGRRRGKGFWGDLVDRFWDWFERDTLRERAREGLKQILGMDIDKTQSLEPAALLRLLQAKDASVPAASGIRPDADTRERKSEAAARGQPEPEVGSSKNAVNAPGRKAPWPLYPQVTVNQGLSPRKAEKSPSGMENPNYGSALDPITTSGIERKARRASMTMRNFGATVGAQVTSGREKKGKRKEEQEKQIRALVMGDKPVMPWEQATPYMKNNWNKSIKLPKMEPMHWLKLLALSEALQRDGILKTLEAWSFKDLDVFLTAWRSQSDQEKMVLGLNAGIEDLPTVLDMLANVIEIGLGVKGPLTDAARKYH